MIRIATFLFINLMIMHMCGCMTVIEVADSSPGTDYLGAPEIRIPIGVHDDYSNAKNELRSLIGASSEIVKNKIGEPYYVDHSEGKK